MPRSYFRTRLDVDDDMKGRINDFLDRMGVTMIWLEHRLGADHEVFARVMRGESKTLRRVIWLRFKTLDDAEKLLPDWREPDMGGDDE